MPMRAFILTLVSMAYLLEVERLMRCYHWRQYVSSSSSPLRALSWQKKCNSVLPWQYYLSYGHTIGDLLQRPPSTTKSQSTN